MRRAIAIMVVGIIGLGCQEHATVSLTPAQQKKINLHILKASPKPAHPLNVIIEDQVKLLGYDISTRRAKPGDTITVTYYLEALAEKMGDNQIFVHFQGRLNDRRAWMNLDHHPVEGLLPLREMKKGQIIKDVQTFKIKTGFPAGQAQLYWGLWRGQYRLKIENAKDVKHDKDGRVIITQIEILPGKTSTPKPQAQADAIQLAPDTEITIDGKLDEPSWAKAPWTAHWMRPDGKPGKAPLTRAKFTWSQTHLYIAVEAIDDDIWSTLTDRDADTWTQEVVEVFIDADGDRKDYLELQVTPANVVFDARFPTYRSELSKARAWDMEGLETAVHVNGTLNERTDRDQGYTVELALPLAAIPGAKRPVKVGQTWRVNLFRFDWPKGGRQQAAAFSPPIVPDFHALNRFGRLRFK
ncbi:MAG: carbohydrate-binding family 9-like protein [Myxococcota bacterium]|nr:carbohydrate-binding family 9-like protein [Myxococcota bacterium]